MTRLRLTPSCHSGFAAIGDGELALEREALLVGHERAGPVAGGKAHVADPDEVQGHAKLPLGVAGINGDELAHDRDNGSSSVNGSPTSGQHFCNIGTWAALASLPAALFERADAGRR
jgi:hypothetical protein